MASTDEFPLPVLPSMLSLSTDSKEESKDDSSFHSPLVFQKPREELAVVHRTEQQNLTRLETHLQEPVFKRRARSSSAHIPNGLASELFKPLWTAVYHPKKLQKKTVIHSDLERLCIALLNAAQMEERPFGSVGCFVKGLCIILSQKLHVVAEDVNALAKKLLLLTTIPAIAGRPKSRKTYREADDDYELPRRRRNANKSKRSKKQMLAVADYYETGSRFGNDGVYDTNMDNPNGIGDLLNTDRDYMPMDQIEILQLMNFGIGLGVGTELAFYSNSNGARERGISYHNFEHGMVERSALSLEELQQNRETINPDTFIDIQSLSSPFKLNGYSFTPHTRFSVDPSDAGTTIASTELALQSDSVELNTPEFRRYDLDWDIYNDPFEEEEYFASNDKRMTGEIVVPVASTKARRMVLEYTEPNGKAVHLVKSKGVARYDSRITSRTVKTPKRVKVSKNQKTLETFTVSPQIMCDKMQLFTDAIDSIVRSVIGHIPPSEEHQEPIDIPMEEDGYMDVNDGPDINIIDQAATELPSTRRGDKWLTRLERRADEGHRAYSPRHTFDNETMSTVQVIEGYRACVREQGTSQPIVLSDIVRGRSKENVALIFYRTLVLANADFIALSQETDIGSPIEVMPSTRFWEPIQTSRDIKA